MKTWPFWTHIIRWATGWECRYIATGELRFYR